MKKFLLCFAVMSIGLNCTKEQIAPLCGCSPIVQNVSLILKNSRNADLLDPATMGAVDKSSIKIQYKLQNVLKDVSFDVRDPFYYGEKADIKFGYHLLVSSQLAALRIGNVAKEFYITVGQHPADTLRFSYNSPKGYADSVTVNGVVQSKEPTLPAAYGTIYYLVK